MYPLRAINAEKRIAAVTEKYLVEGAAHAICNVSTKNLEINRAE
jgi:hypothetical protein